MRLRLKHERDEARAAAQKAEQRIKQLEAGHDEWRTLAHRAQAKLQAAEARAEALQRKVELIEARHEIGLWNEINILEAEVRGLQRQLHLATELAEADHRERDARIERLEKALRNNLDSCPCTDNPNQPRCQECLRADAALHPTSEPGGKHAE